MACSCLLWHLTFFLRTWVWLPLAPIWVAADIKDSWPKLLWCTRNVPGLMLWLKFPSGITNHKKWVCIITVHNYCMCCAVLFVERICCMEWVHLVGIVKSTCMEQSSSRSAPIPDIYYFQSTPEVTSVQLILSFSLTVSLTVFVQNPWSRLCCIHLFKFVIITLHYVDELIDKLSMSCCYWITYSKHACSIFIMYVLVGIEVTGCLNFWCCIFACTLFCAVCIGWIIKSHSLLMLLAICYPVSFLLVIAVTVNQCILNV